MTTVILLLISFGISSYALIKLCDSNAKRLRAHKLPIRNKINTWFYVIIAYLPLIILLLLKNYAALFIWLIGFHIIGWLIALKRPS